MGKGLAGDAVYSAVMRLPAWAQVNLLLLALLVLYQQVMGGTLDEVVYQQVMGGALDEVVYQQVMGGALDEVVYQQVMGRALDEV